MNKREQINELVNKTISVLIIIFTLILLVATMKSSGYGQNEHLKNEKFRVTYTEVNVRKGPDTNQKIVDVLHQGDYVELSGKTYEYLLRDIHSLWYETTDGNWIVSDALINQNDYTYKFGH